MGKKFTRRISEGGSFRRTATTNRSTGKTSTSYTLLKPRKSKSLFS